jgi:hypothetical protein
MTKENILEIVNKEGLFQYNIFDDHKQKANEVVIRQENDQYIVLRTDENNIVIGEEKSYSNENDAINNFVKQLHELKKLYLSTFIGDKYIFYYQDKYKNRPLNKLFVGWKWPPFFIGYGWLIYRKLYIEAAIIFCFLIVAGIILSIVNLDKYLRSIYDSIKIILALIGNSLYYLKINRVLKKINNTDNINHIEYLRKHGGTNIIIAIIFELLVTGIAILPWFL